MNLVEEHITKNSVNGNIKEVIYQIGSFKKYLKKFRNENHYG